jgi:hypothetical protein
MWGRDFRGALSCTGRWSPAIAENGGGLCGILVCASPHVEISELAVCKDFATEIVMASQLMIWEQAQAGDREGRTRRRLQR